MNIIEAIKSKRFFKRKEWGAWSNPYVVGRDVGRSITLRVEDLLADDWEVKEMPVQITREQLYTAYSEALQEVYDMTDIKPDAGVIKLIYQKLGL